MGMWACRDVSMHGHGHVGMDIGHVGMDIGHVGMDIGHVGIGIWGRGQGQLCVIGFQKMSALKG